MVSKESRQLVRAKKHMKIRNRFSGTAERPRLAVFRSNNHMYAQIIDDTVGNTLVSASTLEKEIKAELEKTNNVDAAAYLGTVIAKRAIEKGIKEVVFDRGGFIYQGIITGRVHKQTMNMIRRKGIHLTRYISIRDKCSRLRIPHPKPPLIRSSPKPRFFAHA